jgi:hypothetical protein
VVLFADDTRFGHGSESYQVGYPTLSMRVRQKPAPGRLRRVFSV